MMKKERKIIVILKGQALIEFQELRRIVE